MITNTTYYGFQLRRGTCQSCSEISNEIIDDDGFDKCIDCIQEQKFYEQTMKGL